MKKLLQVFGLSVLLGSFCIFFEQPVMAKKNTQERLQAEENLNNIVAIVNDDVITEQELQKRIGLFKLESGNAMMPPKDIMRSQVLNLMIDQLVGLQTASRAGIEIESDQVNNTIKEIMKRNHLTEAQLKKMLQKQKLTYNDYHDMIRKELTVQNILRREVAERINISKQEVDKYLNSLAYDKNNVAEYLLADLLVALPEVPSSHDMQVANKKINTLLEKLKAGKDFKELAMNYSDAPNALQGGSMGWRRLEEIPSVFADKVESMRAGEFVGPIKTANGLHILKLQDVKGAKIRHVITENKTRHILIKVAIIDDEKTVKAKLVDLRKRINNGESFKDIAKQYSQDPISAAKGGELGWVPPGVMVPEFDKVMRNQKIGEISKPFRSEYGWHILVVESRREKDNTKEFYANELRQKIYQRKFVEESQSFLRRMRNMSYVDIKMKDVDKPKNYA